MMHHLQNQSLGQMATMGMKWSTGSPNAAKVDPWCTPRITGSQIATHTGRNVIMVVKISGYDPTTQAATCECPLTQTTFVAALDQRTSSCGDIGNMMELVLYLQEGSEKAPHSIISGGPIDEGFDFGMYKSLLEVINSKVPSLFN